MSARIVIFLAVCGASILLTPNDAAAQGNFSRRYASPSGPTLTPYLDYFREGNGVLDSYHNFIRPRAQMSNQIQAYDQRLSQTEEQGGELSKDLKKMGQQPRSRAASTGTAATYMNYSHYYSGFSGGGGGGGGGGGRRLSRGAGGRGGGAAAMSMGGVQ